MPILLVTVALVPLLMTPGFLFYFDITPKVVMMLAGTAVALVWLQIFHGGFRDLWQKREGRLFGLLILAQGVSLGVSTVLSTDRAASIHGSSWRMQGLITHGAVLLFILVTAAVLTRDGTFIQGLLRVLSAAGIPIGLYALAQYFGWDPWLPADRYHVGEGVWEIVRPPSTLGHAGYLAGYLLLVVFTGAALIATEHRILWRALGAAARVSGCLGIVVSGTRAAMVGFLAGGAISFLLMRPRISRRAVVSGLASLVAVVAFYYAPPGQKLRARVRWYSEDPRGGPRLLMWRDSARMAAHFWMTGSGPETFSSVFPRFQSAELSRSYPDFYHESPHNFVLDSATSQGIPGVAVLLALCWLGYSMALRQAAGERTLAGLLAGGLTGLITAHLFTTFIVPTLLGFNLLIAMMVFENPRAASGHVESRSWRVVAGAALILAAFFILYAWRILWADHSLALARRSLEAGRVKDAQVNFHHSIAQNPRGSSADLWYSRAMVLAAQKSDQPATRLTAWREAFDAATRATQTADDRHNAWYNLAAFYASQNDFKRTEQSLRSAIEYSPNWFKPHWMLAQVLREAGRLPEAIAEAQAAVNLNGGKNSEVTATLALLLGARPAPSLKK